MSAIAISGGGIAGLTLALALRRIGVSSCVIEQGTPLTHTVAPHPPPCQHRGSGRTSGRAWGCGAQPSWASGQWVLTLSASECRVPVRRRETHTRHPPPTLFVFFCVLLLLRLPPRRRRSHSGGTLTDPADASDGVPDAVTGAFARADSQRDRSAVSQC